MFQLSVCWTLLIVFHLSAGSKWPRERFVLPRPQNGCPSIYFEKGSITMTDNMTETSSTSDLKIDRKKTRITHYFCAKTDKAGTGNFPQGKYCVYKYFNVPPTCPVGMKSGSIHWNSSILRLKNLLVAANFLKTTTFYYCCKVDGDKAKAIELPTENPFFLLAYNSTLCQTVKWMEAWVEYLQYHKQDFVKESFTSGAHPFLSPSYRLHYCFYKACRLQFTGEQESIIIQTGYETFPSQTRYCSWKIKCKRNSTMLLNFTDFEFAGQPSLNFVSVHAGEDNHGRLLGNFSANKSPLKETIKIFSSTMFVLLRCFREHNEKCRFKAKYFYSRFTTAATTSVPYGSTKTPFSKSSTKTANPQDLASTTSVPYESTKTPFSKSSTKTANPQDHSTTMKILSNTSDVRYAARVRDNDTLTYALLGIFLPTGFIAIIASVCIVYKKYRKRRARENNFRGTGDGDEDENNDVDMDRLLPDDNDSLEEISFVINSNSVLRLKSEDSESNSSLGNQNKGAHTLTYLPLTQRASSEEHISETVL